MANELIFLLYVFVTSTSALIALKLGKEALITLISIQCILINLFVTKEITLFGLSATASDALAIGITLSLNLLQEYYNKSVALKAIWISFYSMIFYAALCLLHLSYIPGITDTSDFYFKALLTPMPRLAIASLFVYLVTQHIDCHLYGYFCKKFKNKQFILKNYLSVGITQFIDTALFTFLGLYKLNETYSSVATLLQIIVVCYFIKLITIAISAPYMAISKKIINFNPAE